MQRKYVIWWFELVQSCKRILAALVGSVTSTPNPNPTRLASGIDALDFVLGGGLRSGRLFELGGPPGSGKSTVAWAYAAAAARRGEHVLWVDADGTCCPRVDVNGAQSNMRVAAPMSLQRAVALCVFAMRSRTFSVVVVDALDALSTDEPFGDHRLLAHRKRIENAVRALHAAAASGDAVLVLVRHGERSPNAPVSVYASTRMTLQGPRRTGLGPQLDHQLLRAAVMRVDGRTTDRNVVFRSPALSGERTLEVREQIVDVLDTHR